MIQENVEVLKNNQVGPEHYNIGLTCSHGFSSAIPGQFIMLQVADRMDPLLRRPFSIHKLRMHQKKLHGLELLYKVVGTGTGMVSKLSPGDRVNILGPLGNGFFVGEHVRNAFVVAGGIGVAPMPFLVSALLDKSVDRSSLSVFIGGRSKNDLLCVQDFTDMGLSVRTTTDDGSSGDQCLVTDPVEAEIIHLKPDIIYACGPMEMLSCVIGIAEKYGVDCQVSIETMMACGMGACLGCAVERRSDPSKYLHACRDGPVFDSRFLNI
jgi:dihydroorotate dehydrogenase electron transfer subunit